MAVHHEFFMYRGGVYRASQPNLRVEGYHSVRLIGWGEEPMPNGPPVKYWVRIFLPLDLDHPAARRSACRLMLSKLINERAGGPAAVFRCAKTINNKIYLYESLMLVCI